jgi:hypothetical protein
VAKAFDPGFPVYQPNPAPLALQQEFERKTFKLDQRSGNYLSPKVFGKTRHENLVPVPINGKYVKDLRGQPVFLRESIRAKLLVADEAMFKAKHQHIVINYGFRSNAVQQELSRKLNGKGKVAPAGQSFHETGMALDLQNWRDAQHFMIEAGFVGGCYGIEEDLVHYSVDEITKASNAAAFKRCTLKEIPEDILKGLKAVGKVTFGKLKKK